MTKKWYKSKVLWLNALTVVGTAISAVAGLPFLEEYAPALLGTVSAINFVLRLFTGKSISK